VGSEPLFLDKTHRRPDRMEHNIAFLAVPIRRGRETLGVMSIDRSPREGALSQEEDLRFLTLVANLIGQMVALHRRVAQEREALLEEQSRLKEQLQQTYKLENIVGQSKVMLSIFETVHRVAPSRATVLPGRVRNGKGDIAAIHYNSPRAIPPSSLSTARLCRDAPGIRAFGYEGRTTGAAGKRSRWLIRTLFLDITHADRQITPEGAAGKALRAPRGHKDARRGRSDDRRHEPQPGGRRRERGVSSRPLLPPQRRDDLPAAA
jgi:Nif-specific regulatory protein